MTGSVPLHWFSRHLKELSGLPPGYKYVMICNSCCYYDCKYHDAHWFLKPDTLDEYFRQTDVICKICNALLASGREHSAYIGPEDLSYFDPYVDC